MRLKFGYLPGVRDFDEIEEHQKSLWSQAVFQNNMQSNLFAPKKVGHAFGFELSPVLTAGRRIKDSDFTTLQKSVEGDHFRSKGFSIRRADRGGEWTAHVPGQLMIYFIVEIPQKKIFDFVETILNVSRRLLIEKYQIKVLPIDQDRPGLYTTQGKILSIGLRYEKSVTRYGLALNVSNPVDVFSWFTPCGEPGQKATNIQMEIDSPQGHLSPEVVFKEWIQSWDFQTSND